jgi:epoxide hydrolase-like predicted phosphatase
VSRFEALIVDFGGVLTKPLQQAMARFSDELGIEMSDLVRAALGAYVGQRDDLVVEFETGRISEEEFAARFAERLAEISGRAVPSEGLVRRIFRLELEQEMFTAVARARSAGLKTGLLSNSWGTRYYPRDRLAEVFDAVVISGEVGMRKPDPKIFEHTLDELGAAPKGSVFVDDEPGHLKSAAALGITTVLHRSPSQTISELEDLLGVPLGSPTGNAETKPG